MTQRFLVRPLLVCALISVSVCANASDRRAQDSTLYDRLKQVSVEILVERRLSGSGCVVHAEGLVLTAAHVVGKAERKIEVVTSAGGRLAVKVVAVDRGHDLALLQLPARREQYSSIPLASEMPQAGARVYVFGAPVFRHAVMLTGHVAREGTTFEYIDKRRYIEVIHIGAMTPIGLSGGPWVNEQGELIGMQSSRMSLGESLQGIAFAAPIEAIRRLVRTKESVQTPTLGTALEELGEQIPEFLKSVDETTEGLVARRVKPRGPLASGGIQEGEIITAVNGKPVCLRDEMLRIVRRQQVGQEVTLTVLDSKGESREVVVRLGELGP